MAARTKRIKVDGNWREKIRISMLLNRLEKHALGEDGTEMSQTQLKATEILLRKSLPDLSTVEHTGKDGGAIQSMVRVEFVGSDP